MPFVAGPAGVGVSPNVGVALWYMFNISWLGDRILSKFARIQQLGMMNSRLGLGAHFQGQHREKFAKFMPKIT